MRPEENAEQKMSLISTNFMCRDGFIIREDGTGTMKERIPCEDQTVIDGFKGEEYFCKTCGKLMVSIPGIGIKTWKNGLGKAGIQ